MATIKEIAKMAEVSTATVSYVINKTKKLSDETTKKVNDAIKALNYTPNMVATNLRKGKTCTIGVIVEDIRCFPVPDIINGIGAELEKAKYQMVVHDLHLYEKIWPDYTKVSNYTDRIEKGIKLLRRLMVSGIIYVCMHDRIINDLVEPMDLPLVYAYSSCTNDRNYITYDDLNSAKMMTEYLISLGHTRIGVIGGYHYAYPTQMRLKGIRLALKENGLSLPDEYVSFGDWEYQSGYENAKKLLNLKEPPTAIFALNDIMAAGCYHAAAEQGLKIPDDISIAGFDNRDISRYLYPSLTTMNLPLQDIGKKAFNMLLDSINEDSKEPQQIVLPCQVIKRNSTTKPGKTNLYTEDRDD